MSPQFPSDERRVDPRRTSVRWANKPGGSLALLVPFLRAILVLHPFCAVPITIIPSSGDSSMRHFIHFVAPVALFLSAGLLRAGDGYSIQREDVGQGDVFQVRMTEAITISTKVCDVRGKTLLDNKQATVQTCSFRETVLKCDGKCPTRLERAYEQAQVTTDGKTRDLPYKGKLVLIEKKDSRYSFTMDGKELPYEEAELLVKEFVVGADGKADLERAVMPKNPVEINQSWKMDLGPFVTDTAKGGQLDLVPDKVAGTATLLQVYHKDGQRCAKIKVELTLPIKSLGKGVLSVPTKEGSVAVVDMDVDGCIDGSSKSATVKRITNVEAKSSMSLPDGSKVPMAVSVQYNVEESRQDVTKELTRK